MSRGPDFIIIGAMKCATTTLHEQLACQPGLFMSEPKEPNFFSDDAEFARGMEWYHQLFAGAKAGDLCGESSTHYTKLPTHPRTIERLQRHLPSGVKFIYIMRHPVDRLVSQYIHEWTQREISCPINEAVDQHPQLIAYSRYAMQLAPYVQAYGPASLLPVFFDRLTDQPQSELERVCRFIGYGGRPVWNEAASEQNVSAQRLRKSAWRDAIINLPGAKALRRMLIPQGVRDRIKSVWSMKERPELTEPVRRRLEETFDEDLAELGRWLGMDLNCSNFRQQTREIARTWLALERAPVA